MAGDYLGVHPLLSSCHRRHWEMTLIKQDKEDRRPGGNSLRGGELDYHYMVGPGEDEEGSSKEP